MTTKCSGIFRKDIFNSLLCYYLRACQISHIVSETRFQDLFECFLVSCEQQDNLFNKPHRKQLSSNKYVDFAGKISSANIIASLAIAK